MPKQVDMPGVRKKKILLFTDWYEPGYKAGGPIQACKNVVSVLKEQYDFYIICSDRDLGETSPYRAYLSINGCSMNGM